MVSLTARSPSTSASGAHIPSNESKRWIGLLFLPYLRFTSAIKPTAPPFHTPHSTSAPGIFLFSKKHHLLVEGYQSRARNHCVHLNGCNHFITFAVLIGV